MPVIVENRREKKKKGHFGWSVIPIPKCPFKMFFSDLSQESDKLSGGAVEVFHGWNLICSIGS